MFIIEKIRDFLFIIFIKVKWNFYKQNLEWFDKFFKEFNVNGLEKIEGRIDWYKRLSKIDDKEYALNYLLLIFIRIYILLRIINYKEELEKIKFLNILFIFLELIFLFLNFIYYFSNTFLRLVNLVIFYIS